MRPSFKRGDTFFRTPGVVSLEARKAARDDMRAARSEYAHLPPVKKQIKRKIAPLQSAMWREIVEPFYVYVDNYTSVQLARSRKQRRLDRGVPYVKR